MTLMGVMTFCFGLFKIFILQGCRDIVGRQFKFQKLDCSVQMYTVCNSNTEKKTHPEILCDRFKLPTSDSIILQMNNS
jgi:hypothetical protein